MATDYKSIEYRLHENLVQIQEMLRLLEFDEELITTVVNCKELIKTKKYNVAVMGEFKRGKSSLINALLGSKILPADVTPTTATVNRITYGAVPKTVITYKDGDTQEIAIDELCDYVTKLTPDGSARAAQIQEAIVYFPTVISQNHIDIIDTPGLNDDERMTQITIDMLKNVDAVIVPIHARAPFSETEKKFVCQLMESDNINNIVFVVTFMDQLDEEDYEYSSFMEFIKNRIQSSVYEELPKRGADSSTLKKAHMLLDNLNIYGISSSLALKSFLTNNRTMLGKSNFEEFHTNLLRIVTAKQLENAIFKTTDIIKHVVSQLEPQGQRKLSEFLEEADEVKQYEGNVIYYGISIKKFADTSFIEENGFREAINKQNSLKNQLVKGFIKGLSQIKVNTNEVIHSVLSKTAYDMYHQVNKVHKEELIPELLLIFEYKLPKIINYRHTQYYNLNLKNYGIDIGSLGMDKDEVIQKFNSILKKVEFGWLISPIPNRPELINCNVMNTVITAVDVSVSQYIRSLNTAVDEMKGYLLFLLNDEADRIAEIAKNIAEQKIEAIDIKIKAHKKNFQVFLETSKEILQYSESLKAEFINGEKEA